MPEIPGRFQEFEADLNLACGARAQAGHAAQLLLLRGAIGDQQLLAHPHLAGQNNQRSVRVHDQRMRVLDERSFLGPLHRSNGYGQRNDYPLAAPARSLSSAFHWDPWGHDELCYGSAGLRTMVRADSRFNQ
jgi:hypothetical protein